MTLPDFWNQMRSENLEIVRDTISSVKEDTVLLTTSGATFQTDALVLCTGWGDHFGMFDDATKADIGLPYRKESTIVTDGTKSGPIDWAKYDSEADTTVKNKLPFLASPPKVLFAEDSTAQLRWRLYRRSVPIAPALRGDRSIAIFGQIHTVQTPLVADVQCFWTILYLLNEVKLPGPEKMAQEVAEWNAWTRMRYLSQGAKFPYSLYDFLPVSRPCMVNLTLFAHHSPRVPELVHILTYHARSTLMRFSRTWDLRADVSRMRSWSCWHPTSQRTLMDFGKSTSV